VRASSRIAITARTSLVAASRILEPPPEQILIDQLSPRLGKVPPATRRSRVIRIAADRQFRRRLRRAWPPPHRIEPSIQSRVRALNIDEQLPAVPLAEHDQPGLFPV
jgi:hypothetical protein